MHPIGVLSAATGIVTGPPAAVAAAAVAVLVVATLTPVVLDRTGRGITLAPAAAVAMPALVGADRAVLAAAVAGVALVAAWEVGVVRFRLPGTAADSHTWSPASTLVIALAGAAADAAAVASAGDGPDGRSGLVLRVAAVAAAAGGLDLLLRLTGWLGAPRPAVRPLLAAETCLGCAGALVVLSTDRAGLAGGLIAVVPVAVLLLAFTAHARADRTADQTLDALATLPEAIGAVPAGHAPRVTAMVERLGAALRLDAADQQRLRAAARLHHLHAVIPTDELFERLTMPDGTADLVGACHRPSRRSGDLLAAVVRVACTFDTASAGGALVGAGVLGVRDRHGTAGGAEGRVVDLLLTLLDAQPDLVR